MEKYIKFTQTTGGQVRPYGDSVYTYLIESNLREDEVLTACIEDIHKCFRLNTGKGSFNGNCGYPFGLHNFYQFNKIDDGKYEYKVCEPYCD